MLGGGEWGLLWLVYEKRWCLSLFLTFLILSLPLSFSHFETLFSLSPPPLKISYIEEGERLLHYHGDDGREGGEGGGGGKDLSWWVH